MNYTLDCEFNGYRGELLSLALYTEGFPNQGNDRSRSFYAVFTDTQESAQPWVQQNVMPHLHKRPRVGPDAALFCVAGTREQVQQALTNFLRDDAEVLIHVDWPDDIRYFCDLLITGPGTMLELDHLHFQLHRVDSYPTTVPAAIQHHAWWDAKVLFNYLFSV
jgi:hypothetical protein